MAEYTVPRPKDGSAALADAPKEAPRTAGEPPQRQSGGLTDAEVAQRIAAGQVNTQPQSLTPSYGKIIVKNTCTLFNLINLILFTAILLVGSPQNTLFFLVALCNTFMGIFQEVRAKRTLDKLSILTQSKISVLRNGAVTEVAQESIVLDDVVLLHAGNQIYADGIVLEAEGLEVNESLLTGESDNIVKRPGDTVMSGSFVTAGRAQTVVTAVGAQNFATALTIEAKKEKTPKAPLMRSINLIIRVLAIVIVPLGVLLFYNQYQNSGGDLQASVLGASASMLGMIPEGLVLLTGVTLTIGALKLTKRKALVQSLPCIETLARVDVLCLDKTGTITDGTLSLEKAEYYNGATEAQVSAAIAQIMGSLQDDNGTAQALRAAYGAQNTWKPAVKMPFSSSRKWSGISLAGGESYVLGAPGMILPPSEAEALAAVTRYAAEGYRVLALAASAQPIEAQRLPDGIRCMALLIIADTIRTEAFETFHFFMEEGVTLKVISGDDALTVSTIAQRAGIANADQYIDMAAVEDRADYSVLVEKYTVFGHVSPQQKKRLITALKHNGHTPCMTGDGVNDVLAMKEADCSVAMIGGSDAARGASDFVLMTSDFSAMTDVLREGRQVINNIENVAALYLIKTIYSTLLSILYNFIPYPYPFAPVQMTPINTLTVGIPTFFLALRKNTKRPEGRFLSNVLENSLPAALTVVVNILILQLAGYLFDIPSKDVCTMNVLLTGAVGFLVLIRISRPPTDTIKIMIVLLMTAFVLSFFFFGWFFELSNLLTRNVYFYLPLLIFSPRLIKLINSAVVRLERGLDAVRERRRYRDEHVIES